MINEMVPEMHDLFKLTKYGHLDNADKLDDFYRRFKDYIPDTLTWQGVINHHFFEGIPNYPSTPEVFLISIADHLASGIARESEGRKGDKFYVHKLWNPPASEIDPRLHTDSEIIELLNYATLDPGGEEYLLKYKDLLKARTEDAGKGKNLTSLYTHSVLTGKFFRLLKNSKFYPITEKDLIGKDKSAVREILKMKENEWKMHIARCRILFSQKPIRVKDLNVFATMETAIDKLQQSYSNNMFFRRGNELILFFTDFDDSQKFFSEICKSGFQVEAIMSDKRKLENEVTNIDWIREDKPKQRFYPALLSNFEPPICQICQMAKATKHWPIDFILETKDICDNCRNLITEGSLTEAFEHLCETDSVKLSDLTEDKATEDLCETCYQIRTQGVRLLKLKNWTEVGGTKVVWLKLTLNFDALNSTLSELYEAYLNSLGIKLSKENTIRFPVISEFLDDYNEFLDSFKNKIVDSVTSENIELVANDLICLRIEKLSDMVLILKLYDEEFTKFIPKFKDTVSSPIKLTLVAADSKYPFFEVWDIMEHTKDDILIALVGRGQMRVRGKNVEPLIKAYGEGYRFQKNALEKLAKVAEFSEKLARLTAQDKGDKDYKTYEQMEHLGLDFPSLLTFAKIMEDR